MATMYEMIMDFPLFKGIGREQVSTLLEHNHVVFETFEEGDVIADTDDLCRKIAFIVKGEVMVQRASSKNDIKISYSLTPGAVIGADSLFGWSTSFAADYTAHSKTSLLTFTKEEYLRLLSSNDIYLLNILNYLSRGLQWSRIAAINFNYPGIGNILARWITSITDSSAQNIIFHINRSFNNQWKEECRKLEQEKLLYRDKDIIHIPDARAFCEHISLRNNE